jgi:hypothetical protein
MIYFLLATVGTAGLLMHLYGYEAFRGRLVRKRFQWHVRLLEANPLDPANQAEFLMNLEVRFSKNRYLARQAYSKALAILAENPRSQTARDFAVQLGTWYYGQSRPGGQLLYPDELALRLDIEERTRRGEERLRRG